MGGYQSKQYQELPLCFLYHVGLEDILDKETKIEAPFFQGDNLPREFELFNQEIANPFHHQLRNSLSQYYQDFSQLKNKNKIQGEKKKKKSLTITFGDLKNFHSISLCNRNILHISPNIGYLIDTCCLQMCCNMITQLPPQIGHLKNLTILDLSKNQLESLPETIGYLNKLTELKLSHNHLKTLPKTIGCLDKLTNLLLEDNQIHMLPQEIEKLKNLVTMDLSNNPIRILPSELGKLQHLRKLKLDHCPLITSLPPHLNSDHPPKRISSLKEFSARTLIQYNLPIPYKKLPKTCQNYLKNLKHCSYCGNPFFDDLFQRFRMIEKSDVKVPLIYQLCKNHWNNEYERITLLFSPRMNSHPSPATLPAPPSPAVQASPQTPALHSSHSMSPIKQALASHTQNRPQRSSLFLPSFGQEKSRTLKSIHSRFLTSSKYAPSLRSSTKSTFVLKRFPSVASINGLDKSISLPSLPDIPASHVNPNPPPSFFSSSSNRRVALSPDPFTSSSASSTSTSSSSISSNPSTSIHHLPQTPSKRHSIFRTFSLKRYSNLPSL